MASLATTWTRRRFRTRNHGIQPDEQAAHPWWTACFFCGYAHSESALGTSGPYQIALGAASLSNPSTRAELTDLHAVCVARHPFIAEHLARFFSEVGVDTVAAVGLQGAVASARHRTPDVVVCEYELLTSLPLDAWEGDDVLRSTPVVGVSLTRRSDEVNPLDSNGIAGFLYLPILTSEDARKLLYAAANRPSYTLGVRSGVAASSVSEAV